MGELTQQDIDLGFEPINSIDGFVSPAAKKVAVEFGLTLGQLPSLLKIARDYRIMIEAGTAPSEVMVRGPQAVAARAMMLYEQSARGKPFKFVLPGQNDFVTNLYDHTFDADFTPRGRNVAGTFAKLYERKAYSLLSALQPQLPSQRA